MKRALTFTLCLAAVFAAFSLSPNPTYAADETYYYDFIANPYDATWSSGAGILPFPGATDDERGFALIRQDILLEDGNTYPRVLQMHPQWISSGWIRGTYPQITVMPGAELHIGVGFIDGATGTDGVTFGVYFRESGTAGPSRLVTNVHASYDGDIDRAVISLDAYVGKTGTFRLSVNAGDSSAKDWAVWTQAEIMPQETVVITSCPTQDATVGESYSYQMQAVGGNPPYHWTVSERMLPPGLTLDSDTGLISGTPTYSGTWSFSIEAYDSTELDGPQFSEPKDCYIQVSEAGTPQPTPEEFDFGVTVVSPSLTLNLDPLISGEATSVEISTAVNVVVTSGVAERVYLSLTGLPTGIGGYCLPSEGLPILSSQCAFDATYAALSAGILPPSGDYEVALTVTGGGKTKTQALTLHVVRVASDDLELVSIEPVQTVYGAPLVKEKGTSFRVRVVSTFADPVEATFLLDLPDSQWDTSPPLPLPTLLPSDWQYPDTWGPVVILPGENEFMLPLVPAGGEDDLFDEDRNPAGMIEGGCATLPEGYTGLELCRPDVRYVPRPISVEPASFTVTVDPGNVVAETDETNNSLHDSYAVVPTREWNFLFYPVYTYGNDCMPNLDFVESTAKLQLQYLLANFPIADTKISYSIAPSIYSEPCSSGATTTCGYTVTWDERILDPAPDDYFYEDRGTFLRRIARMAGLEGYNFAVAVGCDCGGGASGIGSAVVIGECAGGHSIVLAHEFNHAVTGMGDIYSLDCLVSWDEAYCEYPDGTRQYCCYVDADKQDGYVGPYCTLDADGVLDCSEDRTKDCVCSCDCSIYDKSRSEHPECATLPICDAACCWNECAASCSGATIHSGPDGRIRHPASEGFWVNRWIATDANMNYFMDISFPGGTSFPHYWMRYANTHDHCGDAIFRDGYINLLNSVRFVDWEDPQGLLVSGTINQDGTAALDPFIYLEETYLDIYPNGEGDYYIALLDENGDLLSKTGFFVSFYMPDPNGGPVDEIGFSYVVEWVSGAQRIELQDEAGQALASRDVSPNAPEITLLSPNGGEVIAKGEQLAISWQASDQDGDALSYSLSLSMDEGETWVPLAIDIFDTEYLLETAALAEGSYLVKVRATDGVNTAVDASDESFSIEVGAGQPDDKSTQPGEEEPAQVPKTYLIVGLVIVVVVGLTLLGFLALMWFRQGRGGQ